MTSMTYRQRLRNCTTPVQTGPEERGSSPIVSMHHPALPPLAHLHQQRTRAAGERVDFGLAQGGWPSIHMASHPSPQPTGRTGIEFTLLQCQVRIKNPESTNSALNL